MTHTADHRLPRRQVLRMAGAGAASAIAVGAEVSLARADSTAELPIVEAGVARAVIHVVDPSLISAAEELVDYLRASTGVTIPINPDSPSDGTRIYIGFAGPGAHPGTTRQLSGLDRDGFLILPYLSTITILGPTVSGTLNGVREFLERYLGVRWLMPGPDGDDVPTRTSLFISRSAVRTEPAFTQRMLSPLRDQPGVGPYPTQTQWAQRNRLQGTYNQPIAFHHNLHVLFPVDRYGQSNPEFYPRGVPPRPGVTTGWQPAFSVPGTIDVAVAGITDYFRANPTATSFSLGVNDGEGYAESDPVPAYYQWVNQVVERVLPQFPDKWFGLLAYHALETPPGFPLHERVVPFLTKDRYVWVDPVARADGHDLTTKWLAVSTQLGFYDYVYGSPYCIPRPYPHLMGDVLRYAHDNAVTALYAELYPNWGEGPKPWLLSRLLWNPDSNVDALLAEWYERAVGPVSAAPLAEYFDIWEKFWAERIPDTAWFSPSSTYQSFHLPQYLEAVSEADVTRSRRLIDDVVAGAQTEPQRRRATILRRTFEYYEASALSYPAPVPTPPDADTARSTLSAGVDTFDRRLTLASRRIALVQEFAGDPVLVHPWSPTSVVNLNWSGWNVSEYWSLVEYLRRTEPDGGPVTDMARQLSTDHPSDGGRRYAALILDGVSRPSLVVNPSFSDGDSTAPPWRLLPRSTGTRAITRTTDPDAGGVMRVTGQGWGGPSQIIDVEPGLGQLTARYRAPAGTVATVQIALDLLDATRTMIPGSSVRSAVLPLEPTGSWQPLRLDGEIPAAARGKAVAAVDLIFLVDSATDISVDFDDVAFRTVRTSPASDNLLINSGFEDVAGTLPAHWTRIAGTVRSSTEQARTGTRSVYLDDSSTSTATGLRSTTVGINAGTQYRASAYALTVSGSSTLYLEFWDSAGARVSATTATTTEVGGWTPVSVTATAPATAVSASVLLYRDSAGTGSAYFDDAALVEVTLP